MFLSSYQVSSLLKRLVDHFPTGGEMSLDVMGTITQTFGFLIPIYRQNGVRYTWALDNGRDFEIIDPRLKMGDEVRWAETLGWSKGPRWFGFWTPLLSLLPSFKNWSTNVQLRF